MLRKRFPCRLCESLTILMVAVTLIASAWAKPKFKILHAVPGGLFSGLTLDSKGNLYGATGAGGDNNHGTIFELKPGAHGWTLITLHKFNGSDGGTPNGGLIFDAAGNLYGTTASGGANNYGTVFKMTLGSGGWSFDDLYDFCRQFHCPDGAGSEAGLLLDKADTLIGTTTAGGVYGHGTVFDLTLNSGTWEETLLYNFCGKAYCHDGWAPYSTPVLDGAGDLYGTTFAGGTYGGGSVFTLKRASRGVWNERVLYSFCSAGPPSCKDGVAPYAGVVIDGSGNLYGTTTQGGGNTCGETTCGTVYKLAPTRSGSWKHTVLYDFPSPANGNFPTGGVVIDKVGNLYGATVAGGIGCSSGCGVAYKLAPGAGGKWKYTVLHKFDGADGAQPLGGLILDKKGNLYGTAYSVVFEITP